MGKVTTKKIRMTLTAIASTMMLVIGTGESCPGQSSSTQFVDQTVFDSVSSTSTTNKGWQSAVIIDEGLNVMNTEESNTPEITENNFFPMAIANSSAKTFEVIMNRSQDAAEAAVFGYITSPADFANNSWPTTLAGFTSTSFTDGTNAQDSLQHPLIAVDGNGDMTAVIYDRNTNGDDRMIASRKEVGSTWEPFVDIRDATDANAILAESIAIGVDSYNNVVVVWCQNANAYYNEYRPFSGWRFTGGTGAGTFDATNDCSTADEGMTIEFDGSGNGYAAFIRDAADFVDLYQWSSDSFAAARSAAITGVGTVGFPKIFIDSDGTTSVFYWDNIAAPNADLFLAVDVMGGAFATSNQFDTGAGSSYMQDNNDFLEPALAHEGDNAVIAWVESDGTSRRVYHATYSGGGSWSTPMALDAGGAGNDVSWVAVDINSSGHIVVAWSADVSGGNEGVYGRVYDGQWRGIQRLDNTNSALATAASATANYRPSASIDASGNAVVTWSMNDQTLQRRAVAAIYQ